MPDKNSSRKNLARKTPARAKTTVARKKSPTAPAAAFHVSVVDLAVTISKQMPKSAGLVASFKTFEEAKSMAIDALLDAIEKAEQHLVALKKATGPTHLTTG